MWRVLLALGAILLASSAHGVPEEYPTVHLRTRSIVTRHEVERQQRRRLQGLPSVDAPQQRHHHTECSEWGLLRHAHQLLLTHRPRLGHVQQEALVAAVEGAGASVAGYLPDHTLLLVGPQGATDALAGHPDVVWLGVHDEQDKLAPEWGGILEQLQAAAPTLQRLAALAADQRQQGWSNGTQGIAAGAAAMRDGLPVATEWDAGSGQLLVGVSVMFPRLVVPRQPPVPAGALPQQQAQQEQQQLREGRVRRLTLQRQQQSAGAAAAADWAPLLAAQYGAQVVRSGADSALVRAPALQLEAVLEWLSQRPAVHWVEPAPVLRFANRRVTTIAQAAVPPADTPKNLDPAFHPFWAAGLTGKGQVVGCGDSGLDMLHCFFTDPAINLNEYSAMVDRIKTFDMPTHRKIRYYRAFMDDQDTNGHGTHVVGTLVGMPYGTTLASDSLDTAYAGMAPDAKVAFIDLSDGTSDKIRTPPDLMEGYFSYTSSVGAAIHSDSWGSDFTFYDSLAAQVDQYSWENPEFLAVFPAGNDGDRQTAGFSSGELTVTSPANAKNCLSAGATQTAFERMETTAVKYSVWDATLSQGEYADSFRVMQAEFGGSVSGLVGKEFPMSVASPLDACAPLTASNGTLAGSVVLIQRGNCNAEVKALAAQAAGVAGVIVFDNLLGSYFTYKASTDGAASVTVPLMSVTRRIGQTLVSAVSTGKAATLSFAASTLPSSSFENLASYSSQGPTLDYRVKPDITAPGTITSAATSLGSADACSTTTYAGTSMATPVVAGGAILLRQYFMEGWYPAGAATAGAGFTPSGALLKAALLGGAAVMTGFEADTGLPVDPPPSFRQGFGRVWLANSVFLANRQGSPQMQLVDAVPINQDETHDYCVRANGGTLSITLVWTDYPGQQSSDKVLVHDIDLTVRAEGLNGVPLLGNGGSVFSPDSPDRENNVEQVALTDLPPGLVSISVRGANIWTPGGVPQYALVVNGDFSGTLTKPGEEGSGQQCAIVVANITSGPLGITNADPAVYEFTTASGSSAGIAFECRLGDSEGNITAVGVHRDWEACTSPASYPGLPDGSYQFAVRAQGEEIASTQNFVKDTEPPTVSFTSGGSATTTLLSGAAADPAVTSEAVAEFAFTGSDDNGVNFTCTLSATGTVPAQPAVYVGASRSATLPVTLGSPFACTSPLPFRWLLPASWQLRVVGTDGAGNAAQPEDAAWSVAFPQAGALYTRIIEGPYGLQPKANLTFVFTALDSSGAQAAAPSGFECWLEAGAGGAAATPAPAYAACASPFSLPDTLQDGQYRFHARLAAVAPGDGTPASSPLTIDSTAPNVTITEAPDAIHQGNSTSLQFTANEEGCTFFCSLARAEPGGAPPADPANFTACTSPHALPNLADGSYLFAVYAVDAVGNQGTPATSAFITDTTPPVLDIKVPAATAATSIVLTYTATDPGSGVQDVTCRFREVAMVQGSAGNSSQAAADWGPCTSPKTFSGLKEGQYGLTLRASDKAGNIQETPELPVYVDFTPPTVDTQQLPELGVPQPSSVTFQLSELSAAPANSYSDVATYQTLVQAVGNATDFASLQLAWQGGTPAPPASGSTPPTAASGAGRRRLMEGGSSPPAAAGPETKLPASAVGTWSNCTAVCTYQELGSGLYSLQVRGIDAAGNMGNTTEPYPFEVDSSLGQSSSSFPLWAIIACAAGGAVVLLLATYLTWRCCCTSRAAPQHSGVSASGPSGAMSTSSYYTYSPGAHSNGHGGHNAYSPGSYPSPPSAWRGAAAPAPARAANGHANGHANGYANGHASYDAASIAAMDPIEQQRLALAQAQAASGRGQGQPYRKAAAGGAADEEQQMRAALEASLREQRRDGAGPEEDAQLRAAIEASLREQQRQQSWGRPGASGTSGWH